jgi:TonB-linked SusC/RagA family outer membrane protein
MKVKLMMAFLLMTGIYGFAQNRQVTGNVRDAVSGDGIIAATLQVKGGGAFAITDLDGSFSINVPSGDVVLEISALGYGTIDWPVAGSVSQVTIELSSVSQSLQEVVVTSFGMRRDKKALPYSVSQIDGNKFTEARTANVGNALTGKIAGVNISPPASGAGGSTRILIRGGSSLGGGDQPLFVINGVPMESGNQGSAGLWGGNDAGDGLAAINPDDIESLSVLKGNTAAALYGARAANGVILITTKSGQARKGMGISFNSNVTMDRAIDQTDFQKIYGQGRDGAKPANSNDALDIGLAHWGTKYDNSQVPGFDGKNRPYTHLGENMNDFYQIGSSVNNSLAFSGGNESGNYRFAVSDLSNRDIMPNASFTRRTANLNVNSKMKKLTLGVSAQYTYQNAQNRPRLSDTPGNANYSVIMKPGHLSFNDMRGTTDKPGALENGEELRYQGNAFVTNPYWGAYNFFRSDVTNRLLASTTLRYDVTDWLYVMGRAGTDFANRDDASYTGYGTAFKLRGDYFETFNNVRQDNFDLFIGGEKGFGNFTVDYLLGASQFRRTAETKGGGGNDLVVPFVHSVTNVAIPGFSFGFNELGQNSVFGSVNFGYKSYLFLNLTGRQDQYSTLSAGNNTLFYPSVGVSAVVSDALELPNAITFAKVRASWAQVGGGEPSPYQLALNYGLAGAGHLGANLGQITNGFIPNQGLKPYVSNEIEVGADLRFLNNKLGVDFAYYSRRTTNDILSANISATSGFGSTRVNIGELTNKGVELLINAVVLQAGKFSWDVSLNYSRNISNAVSLGQNAAGQPIEFLNLEESRIRRERIRHIVGQPLGMIVGFKHRTNAAGVPMYTPEGYPIATAAYETIAEGRHPVAGGFSNTFRYGNFNMSFLLDFRYGGNVVSGTNYFAYANGLHQGTLVGRDGELKVSGVLADGETPINVNITKDRIDDYYLRYAQITENLVYDASYLKLREFSFGYTFPRKALESTPFESLSLSIVGRNLALLWSKVPNHDPESGYTVDGNAQGLEFFAMPQTRSVGLNLSVNF